MYTIVVEGDSSLVIGAILGKMRTPWKLLSLISDIRDLASGFESITFKHIYREANFVADDIAKLGHDCNRSLSWTNRVANESRNALLFDIVCNSCLRGFVV